MKPLLALGWVLGTGAAAMAAQPPNVLFIAVDDLVPVLGCTGDAAAVTPRIDALAARGTVFLNHQVQWPVCGPSRAALTTGLLPEETGVVGFTPIRAALPEVVTLPQHFRASGYATAATGKFHDPRTVGTFSGGVMADDGRQVDDPASWSIPYVEAASGFSPPGKPAVDSSNRPDSDYGDHAILVEGLGLLDRLAVGDQPFFLAVGFKKPHLPFVAPRPYWDLHDRDALPRAAFAGLPVGGSSYTVSALGDNDELLGYAPYDTQGLPTEAQQRELVHGYYACVSFVDSLVGRLLDRLAALPDPRSPGLTLAQTTIVVLWGDHGFHLGDHGKWAKHTVMERSTASPLVIVDPRLAGGRTTRVPAQTIDLFPTLCELAGLPVPEQPLSASVATGRPLRGRSLVPLLQGRDLAWEPGALSLIGRDGAYGYAFVTRRFRLVEWVTSNGTVQARELYDREADPAERRNRIGDPGYAAVAYQLSRAMREDPGYAGATRLRLSGPVPATGAQVELGRGLVPALSLGQANGKLVLGWPSLAGATVAVQHSTGPAFASHTTLASGLADGAIEIVPAPPLAFYRAVVASNRPPRARSGVLRGPTLEAGQPFSWSVAAGIVDPDAGDAVACSGWDGPAWASLSAAGLVSGVAPAGAVGVHYARLRAADPSGAASEVVVQLEVVPAGPARSTSTFEPTDDTFARQADPTLTFGASTRIDLRKEGASSFARLGYVRFVVSGVGTPVAARLLVPVVDETDVITVSRALSDDWSEGTLHWNNRPASGSLLGQGQAPAGSVAVIALDAAAVGNGAFSVVLDEQGNTLGRVGAGGAEGRIRLEIDWIP